MIEDMRAEHAANLLGSDGGATAPEDGVVDPEDDDGANDRDDQAVDV
jgi:hypothetical protein